MAKFCENCGKHLDDNQICDCRGEKQPYFTGFNDVQPYHRMETKNNVEEKTLKKEIKIKLPPIRIPSFDTSSPRNFWASMLNNMGIGDPESNKGRCFEENDKIVPDNLRANDGEIPIKQYKFAILRTRLMFMKAKGRLQITNKRIIFRAPGRSLAGRTLFQNEFDINQIHGLRLQRGYRFSWWNFIVHGCLFNAVFVLLAGLFMLSSVSKVIGVILFSLLGLGTFFTLPKLFPLKWILNGTAAALYAVISASGATVFLMIPAAIHIILLLISMALHCCQKDMKFLVDTASGTPSIVIDRERRRGLAGLFGAFGHSSQQGTGYREVMPDVDTERAVRELNAIISDLQTMGDLAVAKWKED